MRIYLPSRGRATLQHTWNHLPPAVRANAVVVVSSSESSAYVSNGVDALICPKQGIGPVRQWIVDQHEGQSLLMLDDDLSFFKRRDDDPTKVRIPTAQEITAMFKDLDRMAKYYVHGGIATRQGSNRNTSGLVYNTRNLRALFYDAAYMRANNVRFDRVPVMEDFDVALQLLRLGADSVQLNSFVQDQPGSNTLGGCSEYRTAAVQAAGARGLAALHPGLVTVVEKEPLKSGGWNGEPRVDVRVSWKKALGYGA